jgi:hypothetical protein
VGLGLDRGLQPSGPGQPRPPMRDAKGAMAIHAGGRNQQKPAVR